MSNTNSKFSNRRFVFIGLVIVSVLVGGVGRWFATAEISGAVIASGSIKVKNNRQIIQHPYGGVVEGIYVTEGDQVAEGAVLLRFDDSELSTEMQIVGSQLAEVLARTARLRAERDGANQITFPQTLEDMRIGSIDIDDLVTGQQRLFESRATTILAR
jgi:HlyD family secretion protein